MGALSPVGLVRVTPLENLCGCSVTRRGESGLSKVLEIGAEKARLNTRTQTVSLLA